KIMLPKWDQKEPTPMVPIRKKEKNYANNKSQKQKENEKHTLHNIFNFIIAVIQNLLHRICPRKGTAGACI
ncbi:MAG: hypothetical protein ACLR4X_00795, partial [Clostridia bacterium]